MCDIIINETMDNLRRPITTFCIGGGGSHLTRGSVAFNHIKIPCQSITLLLIIFTALPMMTQSALASVLPQNNMKK